MDGRQKAERQKIKGTRPIVEELDRLRMLFGFDKVQVLTPIVESRLRSGLEPPKPLCAAVTLRKTLMLELTFKIGYPLIPVVLEITGDNDVDELTIKKLQQTAEEFVESGERSWIILVEKLCSLLPTIGTNEAENPQDEACGGQFEHPAVDVISDINEEKELLLPSIPNEKVELETSAAGCVLYCCRICSNVLFDQTQLHAHSISERTHRCTSYFLEDAPPWLSNNAAAATGAGAGAGVGESDKLYCGKCKARVGSWSWAGSKCSCEAWITPAFQFVKSKVDEKFLVV